MEYLDLELLVDEFVSHEQMGESERWQACKVAWMLYQNFPDRHSDITELLTSNSNLSETAVYNRRDAWAEYDDLYPGKEELPDLGYSHFYRLRHLRYSKGGGPGVVPLTQGEAREYLDAAQASSWSIDTMIHQILSDAVLDGRTNGVELQRRQFETWLRKANKLIEGDVPQAVKSAIYNAIEITNRWLDQMRGG